MRNNAMAEKSIHLYTVILWNQLWYNGFLNIDDMCKYLSALNAGLPR